MSWSRHPLETYHEVSLSSSPSPWLMVAQIAFNCISCVWRRSRSSAVKNAVQHCVLDVEASQATLQAEATQVASSSEMRGRSLVKQLQGLAKQHCCQALQILRTSSLDDIVACLSSLSLYHHVVIAVAWTAVSSRCRTTQQQVHVHWSSRNSGSEYAGALAAWQRASISSRHQWMQRPSLSWPIAAAHCMLGVLRDPSACK
mmetsp:Transcript_32998/g.84258  ORF Transcript_32998/g.84258 Transcript_32998/m.84258 type:complete len:201 (+) Transcript_32998:1935-2537(+)